MSNTIFTGASRYSSDFQSVIDRSIQMASLPLTQMQQAKSGLNSEVTALKTIEAKVSAIGSTLARLQQSVGYGASQTSVSDAGIARATSGEGVLDGTYSLEVVSLGSYTTAVSKGTASKVSNPDQQGITTATSLTLTIDDISDDPLNPARTIAVKPASSSLKDLVEAINTQASGDVQATIVNVGTTSDPDYRLSLQSGKLGSLYLQLNDGTGPLIDLTPDAGRLGTKAEYKVNGSSAVQADSRTVTLAPNLVADLLKPGATSIAVSRNSSAFTTAINDFISAYNGVVDALDAQHGDSNAALAGHSILSSIKQTLKQAVDYAGTAGGLDSLASIGIVFDRKGKLTVDSSVYPESVKGKLDDLKRFMGTTTGSGLLKALNDAVNTLTGSTTGVLSATISSTEDSIGLQSERIEAEQRRIDLLTESLQKRMYQADAAIAALEQQVTYFTGMFAAMKSASESMQ